MILTLQTYMFYQLKYFNPSASESLISTQAGIIVGSKTAAQVCTGMLWGRLADSEWGGRKAVLMIGLLSSGNAYHSTARLLLMSNRPSVHWIRLLKDLCVSSRVAGIWWCYEQQCWHCQMCCGGAESRETVV